MTPLTPEQIDAFQRDGVLVVPDAVSPTLLTRLQQDFAGWVEQSREHSEPFGETINHRPRFDLDGEHSPTRPGLRRVNAPVEISDAFYEAMADSPMTDFVASLIGPDVKFHHSKINSKLPGANTEVKWHQDFPFTPHSNDDVVTALLMVDEVTPDNGPLAVRPGSHTGPIHGLWHGGRFTGAIDDSIAAEQEANKVLCTGTAGSVCLMHTRLLHGSHANASKLARTLFICVYSADDAVSLSPNPMPNQFEGMLVRGQATGRIRAMDFEVERPELPATASFFDQQAD